MKTLIIVLQSFKKIKQNKFDYLFLFFQLVVFVGTIKQFSTDQFLVINFFIVLVITLFKKRFNFKGIPIILGIFTFLLIPPILIWGAAEFEIYIGFYLRILTAILLISYFRMNFFIYFENLMFILALISLPLYLIQIINIQFFDLFKGFSELVLIDERLIGRGILSGHSYLVIFNVNSWAELRNSGFAWEPAVFGTLLVWAALFNYFIYKKKFNFKLLIFILTALTTFSIGTFIYFIALFIFIIYNSGIKKSAILIAGAFILLYSIFSFSLFTEMSIFMKDKALRYIESIEDEKYTIPFNIKRNRVQGIIIGLNLAAKSPMGYGLAPKNPPDAPYSSNGFFNIIYKYGVIGGILVILLLNKIYLPLDHFFNNKSRGKFIFIIILFLTLNGNPFYHQPFFLALLLSGFLIMKYYPISTRLKKAYT